MLNYSMTEALETATKDADIKVPNYLLWGGLLAGAFIVGYAAIGTHNQYLRVRGAARGAASRVRGAYTGAKTYVSGVSAKARGLIKRGAR